MDNKRQEKRPFPPIKQTEKGLLPEIKNKSPSQGQVIIKKRSDHLVLQDGAQTGATSWQYENQVDVTNTRLQAEYLKICVDNPQTHCNHTDDLQQLRTINRIHKDKINNLEEEITFLKEKITNFNRQESVRKSKSENDLQKDIYQLRKELRDLKTANVDLKRKCENLEKRVEDLELDNKEMHRTMQTDREHLESGLETERQERKDADKKLYGQFSQQLDNLPTKDDMESILSKQLQAVVLEKHISDKQPTDDQQEPFVKPKKRTSTSDNKKTWAPFTKGT